MMDGKFFIILQEVVVSSWLNLLLTEELLFHSKQKKEETVFILKQPKEILISARFLLKNISLMSMWLAMRDGHHFIFLCLETVMN